MSIFVILLVIKFLKTLFFCVSLYSSLQLSWSMVVSRGDLESHLKGVCPLRHYSCPDCGKPGTHHYITTEHQQQCPEAVVPCPNGCGFVPITRRLEANHCKVCPNQVQTCTSTLIWRINGASHNALISVQQVTYDNYSNYSYI